MKMPNLKQFNPIGKSVNSTDVLLGAAAGFYAQGLVRKHVIDRFFATNATVQKYGGVVAPALTAALLSVVAGYVPPIAKRQNGLFIGALAGGLLPAIAVKAGVVTGFGETVAINLQGLNGLLIDEDPRAVNGLGYMVDESVPGLQGLNGMGDLAALSMQEDDDYDGLSELVNVQF